MPGRVRQAAVQRQSELLSSEGLQSRGRERKEGEGEGEPEALVISRWWLLQQSIPGGEAKGDRQGVRGGEFNFVLGLEAELVCLHEMWTTVRQAWEVPCGLPCKCLCAVHWCR